MKRRTTSRSAEDPELPINQSTLVVFKLSGEAEQRESHTDKGETLMEPKQPNHPTVTLLVDSIDHIDAAPTKNTN